ncbi:MAG: serine/threonine-protein kinase RsbW [Thermoleophilaceae bacterium]|nr:serine/threonine-protein kinase RsbW [Thermoleophilaceae bacterium]
MSFELAGGPYAVTAARLALAKIDDVVDESQAFDVRLLVSELVTNSVQHAKVGPDESIKLDVSIASELIRVEITDHGPGFEPPTDTGGAERERGWGLFFVSQLATRWGVEPGEPGCVWFEIDRTASGEEAAGQTAA